MNWNAALAIAAGIVTFYGAADAVATVAVPYAERFVDERVELRLAGAAQALEKRLNTIEQTAKDTNKDVEELKRKQTETGSDVKNIKEGVTEIGDDVDRILDRLIPHR